ncbi:MAG: TetR/AcrR family transcriptional regulator [Myxococcota bacterium]|jgi:AcrR family transcriptional regulator|nr:TetR/AcrR family transcriptional regulator [Myxococcota bacterium]MEC9439582.1 TetR/AcrR family transcriptional regulator [Myxococcota bacterium]
MEAKKVTTKRLPAAKRRKQILKSAITVFARSTYHGATTKSISEEAGVTEALIYRYFGSKRALFTEGIAYTSDKIVTGLEEILSDKEDHPVATLQRCFAYYMQMLERNEEFARMIFLVLSELDQQDIRETYLPHQERALKAIARKIREWKQSGFVDEGLDIQTTAWLFFGTYLILALVKHSHDTLEFDPEHVVKLAKPYLTKEVFEAL